MPTGVQGLVDDVTAGGADLPGTFIERFMKQTDRGDFYEGGQRVFQEADGTVVFEKPPQPFLNPNRLRAADVRKEEETLLEEITTDIGPRPKDSYWFKGWKHESGVVPEFVPGIGGRAFNLPAMTDTMVSSLDARIAAGEFEGGGINKAASRWAHEFSAHSLTGIETMVPGREEIPDAWSAMVAASWGTVAGLVSLIPGGSEEGRGQLKEVTDELRDIPVLGRVIPKGIHRWHRPASAEAFAPRDLTVLGMPLGVAKEMEYYHKRHPAAFLGSLASEAVLGFALKGVGKIVPLGSGVVVGARIAQGIVRIPGKFVPKRVKTAGKVIALSPVIAARQSAALGLNVMGKAAPIITRAARGAPIVQPIMKKIPSTIGTRRMSITGESIGDGLFKLAERVKMNRAKKEIGKDGKVKWIDPDTGETVSLLNTRFGSQWFGVKPWGQPKAVKTRVYTEKDSIGTIIKDMKEGNLLFKQKMVNKEQYKILNEWKAQTKITGEIAEEMSGNLSQVSKSELDELSKLYGKHPDRYAGRKAEPGDLIKNIVEGTTKKLDDTGKVPKGMEKYLPEGQVKKFNRANKAVKQIEEEGLTKIIPELRKREVLFRVTPGQQKIMEEQFHAYAMKGKGKGSGRPQVITESKPPEWKWNTKTGKFDYTPKKPGDILDVWEIRHGIDERMLRFGLGDFRFKEAGRIAGRIPGGQFLTNLSNRKRLVETIRRGGRRVGKKGLISLEDQGNIIDLIRPALDPTRKWNQRYQWIGAKPQKSVADQIIGREAGERPTAVTLGPFAEGPGKYATVTTKKDVSELAKEVTEVDFVGDAQWSFFRPGGFMFRKTTKYSQRPSSSFFKDFKGSYTRGGKDKKWKKFVNDIDDAERKTSLDNLRESYKKYNDLEKKPTTKETIEELKQLHKKIDAQEQSFFEKYKDGEASTQRDFAEQNAKAFGASSRDLGAMAFHVNKHGQQLVTDSLDSKFKGTMGMGDDTLELRAGADNISLLAQQKQNYLDSRVVHDLTEHLHAEHHNFLQNRNPFPITSTIFDETMPQGRPPLLTRQLQRSKEFPTGLFEDTQENKLQHAVEEVVSVRFDTEQVSTQRLRTKQDLESKYDTVTARKLRTRPPRADLEQRLREETLQRTRVGTPEVKTTLKIEQEQRSRFADPLTEYARLRNFEEVLTDTRLDDMIALQPRLETPKQEQLQEQRFRFDEEYAMARPQEYDEYIRERYETEYQRPRPPEFRRTRGPRTPFFLPGLPVPGNKITKKTPTPKTFQKQILNPIGELKIVDKEQIKAYQSDRHKLHDMTFNTGKKGLNLI